VGWRGSALQILRKNLKDLQSRLERAHKMEDEARKMKEQPIKYAKEFMAMTNEETSKFMDYFMKIDEDQCVGGHGDSHRSACHALVCTYLGRVAGDV
jgi:hypothetical protein